MKPIVYILFSFLATAIFTSCEKVIDVDVKAASKKYVIEGVLTDQSGSCQVKITQTKNLAENNSFEGIRGAHVSITDEQGIKTDLTETNQGIYQSNLKGEPGKQYSLHVTINGEYFTAVSKMPHPVSVDSLYTSTMDMMKEQEQLINVVFTDPVGKGNAYRFVEYVNGKKDKGIFVQKDDLLDGRLNTITLFKHGNGIKKGDAISVELQCIDASVYKYWYSLSQGATGEGNSASPANPVTNINGGALGYFSAYAVTVKSIVAQ